MVRVASAVVILAALAATVWWLPPWATAAVAALLAALGAYELAAISGALNARVPAGFLAAAAAIVTVAFVLEETRAISGEPLVAVGLVFVIVAGAVALTMPPDAFGGARASVLFRAPWYLGLPLGAIASIRWTAGAMAVALLVVVMVVSDSAQYYTGRTFGRHKLAPRVSPAKTVEGAIGGLIAASIAGAVLVPRWITPTPPSAALLGAALGLVLAVVGMMGDLFESSLKRSAGIKDSSSLIPGHGGVLDRLDSYLFAAPMYFLFLRYLA
jgi:phosphatidate cytidylyltransferase